MGHKAYLFVLAVGLVVAARMLNVFQRGEIMILKPNKYLKELGIDEHYWLFDKSNQDDNRYVPDEEGFVDAEHFSLDTSLSLYIYSQLCYFKEYCLYGTPMGMSIEKWTGILDAMIEGFRLLIVEEQVEPWLSNKERYISSKNRQKKINYGLRMFIKYYHCLWY